MNDQSPTLSDWDANVALANIDGDVSDLKELFEIWLIEEPLLRSRIQTALSNNDPNELHLAAHSLKGSLKLFGFRTALPNVMELESAGKSGRIADGVDLFQQTQKELKLVNRQVMSFLANE